MTKKGNYKDMTELFNLAACKALHMSQPSPPKISIGIEIGQPPMNGGLSSIQESMNIGGEPHRLSYINSDEASLLRQLGGSGQLVNGIPAFNGGGGMSSGASGTSGEDDGNGVDEGEPTSAAAQEEADAMASAAASQASTPGGLGMGAYPGWTDEEADKVAQLSAQLQGYGTPDQKESALERYRTLAKEKGWTLGISTMEQVMMGILLPSWLLPSWLKQSAIDLDTIRAMQHMKTDPAADPETKADLGKAIAAAIEEREGIYSEKGQKELEELTEGRDPQSKGLSSMVEAPPCAPGEVGWPECEADVEEPSVMLNYLKARAEDKDSDDPTDERMIWWNSLPQHIKDSLRLTYPKEGKGGIPERLLADIA